MPLMPHEVYDGCMPTAETCCGECQGIMAKVVQGCVLKCAMNAIEQVVCGACTTSSRYQLGIADCEDSETLESLVACDSIKKEFADIRHLSLEEAVAEATPAAIDLIKKAAFFLFGLSKQGKSTLVNLLLQEMGNNENPALVEYMDPCTRSVETYKQTVEAWTTPGVKEEVILFDTEGWELGQQKSAEELFGQCLHNGQREGIEPVILQQRLVLVLVLNAERRGDINDPKFLDLVGKVCKKAAEVAKVSENSCCLGQASCKTGPRPVLLPVVSKSDLFKPPEKCKEVCKAFTETLKKKVGGLVDVKEAKGVTEEPDASGRRPSIRELQQVLADISKEQLQSEQLLEKVKQMIEDDLLKYLRDWDGKGLNATSSLVRRFLWAVARHRGLRIKDLHGKSPRMNWEQAEKVMAHIRAAGTSRNISEKGSTRVDICLHDSSHRGLRSKALINFLLNRYPMARPVTLVLKQWLIEQAYSMSHSGGLCSYGLLLMVVALLQHFPATSLAAALVGFLNFYGRRFDPQLYGVSVARAAFLKRKSPTTWPPEQAELVERGLLHPTSAPAGKEICGEEAHRFDPLWVEDPVNPTNNVGRNCFRIRQIQRSLARAADVVAANEAGATLRAILRVETYGAGDGQEAEAEALSMRAKHDLQEDLYLSLVEHGGNLMLPISAQGRMARSHLPQQWDSVVRYAESSMRPAGSVARY
ncbi:Trf4-1 [Symbiodinium sp. CCMP2592]|nr:Trf4-1 [Symbiodinium sp. CCMP2592]